MRSGLESTSNRNYGAWVQSRNWVRYALTRPLIAEPGTRDGIQHRQHAPAVGDPDEGDAAPARGSSRRSSWPGRSGSRLAKWPQDPQGIYFGGNDMLMTPRQMVRFGELYENDGRVEGREVLPKSWIDDRSSRAAGRAGAAIANTATAGGSASSVAATRFMRGGTADSSFS